MLNERLSDKKTSHGAIRFSENVWINQHPLRRLLVQARTAFLSSNTLFIPSCIDTSATVMKTVVWRARRSGRAFVTEAGP